MQNFLKWSMRGVMVLFILFVLAAAGFYYLLARSLPDYQVSKPIITADYQVDILRDLNAIPHIYGESDQDSLFGLGYAHAQDRLWQMSLLRRTSQGRLSEVFGTDLLALDEMMRALDLWNISETSYRNLDDETRALLDAYADGVNAYIDDINENARGMGAPEFLLFSREIAPWHGADSIALLKLIGLQLSGGARMEIDRALMSRVLTPDEIDDIYYQTPRLGATPYVLQSPTERIMPREVDPITLAMTPGMPGKEGGASNAFVAAPSRSANGDAILANDPHLPFTAPSVWMLAHIHFGDREVIGGSFAGVPLILIGQNGDLAWGLTTSYLDDQDLTILRLSEDGESYITPDGNVSITRERLSLRVKDEEQPRVFERESTPLGPIVPLNGPWDLARIAPEGHKVALSWTGFSKEDTTIRAGFALMRAGNIPEAEEIIGDYIAPAQMLSLADSSGNIAQLAIGRAPIRSLENASQGRFPAASWLGGAGFSTYFPPEENPASINPENGLLLHTNQKFVDAPYPKHWGFDWGDNYRIGRAEDLLAPRRFHTRESFIEAQNDNVDNSARVILPLIARAFWFRPGPETQKSQALRMLGEWHGEFDALNPEPLIFAAWMEELNYLIFSDELGASFELIEQVDIKRLERVYRNIDGAAKWCDIRPTEQPETCPEIAESALEIALGKLSALYGDDITTWRWGRAHMAIHQNQTLGRAPLIGAFANIVQEVDGSGNTLLRAKYLGGENYDFNAVHGAGLRMVVDFSDIEHSKFMISTGQSGHILSKHYDDLSVLWRVGEYLDMTTDREIIEGNLSGQISFVIEPEN